MLRLDDREAHAASLTLAATRLLRTGKAREAFELADRRCRMSLAPAPADRAVRALAGRLAGWPFWRDDLETALGADPLDPVLNATLLRLGEPDERREAALRLAAAPDASAHALEDALAHLFETGERAAARLDLVDNRLSGWIAWTGEGEARLAIEGTGDADILSLSGADATLPFLPEGAVAALIEMRLSAETARRAVLRLDGAIVAEIPLVPRSRRADGPLRARAPKAVPLRAPLAVLVPVYEDLDATAACLDAVIAETRERAETRLLVVDDASPNAALARHLRDLAAKGLIELWRNETNLGFAGAVARGLREAGAADIVLLNADAILPPRALDRLTAAAYGAADIGTVTPFSNNGEYTSFPRPGIANTAPSAEAAERIDAACARLALPPIDLPTGTGFCLFLRHDARAAVGGMPAIYGRGYFEDMEFCLRAREAGFRNVCTPALFVTHHGSLSFGAQKAALVPKNLKILRQRFPATRADCAAFAKADPLEAPRAAIEAELPGREALPILVAREGAALLSDRLAHHGGQALQMLWNTATGRPTVQLLGPRGAAPQSLRFRLGEEEDDARLQHYLAASAVTQIEILGADAPPAPLVSALATTLAPIDLVFGDVPLGRAPSPNALLAPLALAATPLASRLRHAIAAEAQAFAMLGAADLPAGVSRLDARPVGEPAPPLSVRADAPASLALLSPRPIPASDAFARALSAALHARAPASRIVLLGQAVDDLALLSRGNIAVTGPVPPGEEADLLRLLGVRALVLPPLSPFLAEAGRMAGAHALPLAIADWTFGQIAPDPQTLFLDANDRDAGNALATADWFAHRLPAAAA